MSLIALAFAAALAGQQPAMESPCEVDRRSDACEQARFDETLAEFDLPTIVAEAATGAEVYRAFLRNPWGRTLPVISFERRPGEPPAVVVKDISGDSLFGHVSIDVWEQVVDGAIYADRDLVPLPPPAPPAGLAEGELYEVICTDASTVVVELANTRDRWGDLASVRRNAQNTCDGGLAVQYGALLTELALKSIPPCAALGPAEDLDGTHLLRACLSLRGDTVAAAGLLKSKWDVPDDRDRTASADDWAFWLNTQGNGRIDWAGRALVETPSQSASLSDFMAERSSELENLRIYLVRAGATDSVTGWMDVEITYGTADGERMIATSRQVWRRVNEDWSLQTWTVDPFGPIPPLE